MRLAAHAAWHFDRLRINGRNRQPSIMIAPNCKRSRMDYQRFFEEAIDQSMPSGATASSPTSSGSPAGSPRAIWRATARSHGDHRLVLQRLSRHGPARGGDRRHAGDRRQAWASAPAARATFPAPTIRWSSSSRARRPPRQGSGAGLHLGLRLQRGGDLDHRQAAARLRDPLRRAQPRLDDRGRAPLGRREEDLPPQRRRASRKPARSRRPRAAEADRLRIGLFDGRRHRADRARSPTSPRSTAP